MYPIASKFSQYLDYMARFIIVAIMLLIVINVLLRKLFGCPISGTYELTGLLTSAAISLALANCAAKGGHIAVSLITDMLSKKIKFVIELIMNTIVLSFLAWIFWIMVSYGKRIFISGRVGMSTEIPLYYFVFIIAIGFICYSFIVLENLIYHIIKDSKR